MSYILDKNNKNFKLSYFSCEIEGLDITPNQNAESPIKAKKIVLADKALIDDYVKQRINKKLNKILTDMLRILDDEDTSTGDIAAVLGEIDRLKGIIINKYKEFLKKEEYTDLLKKILIAEEEFKMSYNQKMVFKSTINYGYDNNFSQGKGR